MNEIEMIRVNNIELLKETEKAYNVKKNNHSFWIPKSISKIVEGIVFGKNPIEYCKDILIQDWFVEKLEDEHDIIL